jgi:hypothetical protein
MTTGDEGVTTIAGIGAGVLEEDEDEEERQ